MRPFVALLREPGRACQSVPHKLQKVRVPALVAGQSSFEFAVLAGVFVVMVLLGLGVMNGGPDSVVEMVREGFMRFLNALSLAY